MFVGPTKGSVGVAGGSSGPGDGKTGVTEGNVGSGFCPKPGLEGSAGCVAAGGGIGLEGNAGTWARLEETGDEKTTAVKVATMISLMGFVFI
jgi:hypothetical protein